MADDGSMLNTPPTFAWYIAGLVFKWLQGPGWPGGDGRAQPRQGAAAVRAIDASGFYRNPVARDCRSWMNVPFTLRRRRSSMRAFLDAGARGGTGESRGSPLGRRHARQPLQRHAARGRGGAGGLHAGLRAPPRLSSTDDLPHPHAQQDQPRASRGCRASATRSAPQVTAPGCDPGALGRHARVQRPGRACAPSAAPAPAPTTFRSRR